MYDGIKASIFRVNENIYDYRLNSLVNDLCSIMDSINSQMEANPCIERNVVNSIFKSIISALENKDYLLIADILIFELLPNIEINSIKNIYIQQ